MLRDDYLWKRGLVPFEESKSKNLIQNNNSTLLSHKVSLCKIFTHSGFFMKLIYFTCNILHLQKMLKTGLDTSKHNEHCNFIGHTKVVLKSAYE